MAEHVPKEDFVAFIGGLAARLRPGGHLVISAWHPFMIMHGVPTHYEDDAAGIEYVLPSHVHLHEDYLRAFLDHGLRLDTIREPRCDTALISRMPHMEKHRGFPLALIWRAIRNDSEVARK
jgi:hypothetical protein